MTPIGQRRYFIRIEQPSPSQEMGAWNNPEPTWSLFATAYAAKLAHSGREFYRAQQRVAEISEVFNVAPIPGLTTRMRIVLDGRYYNIVDIDDSDPREMNISAVAVV